MNDAGSTGQGSGTGEGATAGVQEKAQEVVGQAQEKAQEATGKARGMLRDQIDQRSGEAAERISGTAGDLRSVGEELRNQGKETPAKLAEQAAERTERIGSYLSRSDSEKLLSDLEDFGRRQPLAVLAGGVVVGVAAARFLKASSRNRYQGRVTPERRGRELTGATAGSGAQVQPRPIGAPSGDPVATAAEIGPDPALRR